MKEEIIDEWIDRKKYQEMLKDPNFLPLFQYPNPEKSHEREVGQTSLGYGRRIRFLLECE